MKISEPIIAFKREKLTALKLHRSSNNDQVLVEMSKYHSTAIRMNFNIKFVLEAKVKSSTFGNTSNPNFCQMINLDLSNFRSYRKYKA